MALSSYDIRFILSVSDRTGNSLRRVAGDMRGVTADATRMKKAFAAMDVGRGLQLRGLLAGAGLGVAAQQAANFQTSVTKAASQIAGNNDVQKIGQNTIKLQEQILGLMKQFPASAQEQADAAYDIFSSMNVPLKQGVGLLKLFNMVAVAGATDLSTAANAMITILNNFGGSWDKTMKAVNTSFAIIRFGRLEFNEFNDMLNAVVPSAKAAGQSLEDVSGAMAFITTRIPSQKQGATAISRLLEVFTRSDFRAGAKKLRLNIEEADGALKPLPQIIGELARLDVAKAKSTINSLFSVVTSTGRGGGRGVQSTIQARRALTLLVTQYQEYVKTQRNVTGATSEFEKRYTAMIGSAGVKWEKFKAQLQALLIMVGAAVIPAFERLGGVLQHGIDWARQNRGTIEFIAKATLAVAVASLLAGTFLKLYGAALIVFTGLKRISMIGGGFLAVWARLSAVGDTIVGVLGRIAGGLLLVGGKSGGAAGNMGTLTTRLWLAITAITTLNGAGLRAAFSMGKFATATWLLITAISTLNITGVKAALSMVPLASMLARFAKIGVITIGINVIMNFMKKEKRDRAGFLAKRGLLGSAAFELMFGTDFGTSKWFQSKETKDAIDAYDKKQKTARKTGFGNIQNNMTSDVKKLIASIKKDLATNAGKLFDDKMLKSLGLDPQTINDQVNSLINQPAGANQAVNRQAQFAKDVVARQKELLTQASSKLVEVYQGFREANQTAFGDIFAPIEGTGEEEQLRKAWNWTAGADTLLGTMKARLAQFRAWRGELAMLLRKGFSKDFVDEFKKMGPEGLKYIDELKKAGPKKVQEFNQVMAGSKNQITKATEIDFNTQLKKWNSFGKDTAFKIILGMESEEQGLQTRMNNMVGRLYSGVAKTIAAQQVKLEQAAAQLEIPAPKFHVGPPIPTGAGDKTVPGKEVAAAGYKGRYAIPDASIGPLPINAVVAMGERYNAMARFYGAQTMGGASPIVNNFNVNGTFMTPKEMMDAAMRSAAHKTRHKR